MTDVSNRARVDRDEVFVEYTKSICPVCKAVVDAEVNIRDNKVFLRNDGSYGKSNDLLATQFIYSF